MGYILHPPPLVGYHSDKHTIHETEERNDVKKLKKNVSSSSILSTDSGCSSLPRKKSSSVDIEAIDEIAMLPSQHSVLSKTISQPYRKGSVIEPPRPRSLSGSEPSKWQCTIQSNMIVGAYGDNTYPLLTWNSKLNIKVHLHGSSKESSLPPSVAVIDPENRILKISIKNTKNYPVAFSIQASRQSNLFKTHIILPNKGLHLLQPGQVWEGDMDAVHDTEKDEYLIINVLLCTIQKGNCSWNINRQYAMLKTTSE